METKFRIVCCFNSGSLLRVGSHLQASWSLYYCFQPFLSLISFSHHHVTRKKERQRERERERERESQMKNTVGRTKRTVVGDFSRPADDTIHPKWDNLQIMIIKKLGGSRVERMNERIKWGNFFFSFIHLHFFIFVNRQLSCHLFHLHSLFFSRAAFLSAPTDQPTDRLFIRSLASVNPAGHNHHHHHYITRGNKKAKNS